MNTMISRQVRVAGFFFSILMSAAVLGTTVLSMQASTGHMSNQVVALEPIVVSAHALN
jgi:hypothetical protein